MLTQNLKAIGLQVNQIYFDTENTCTIWGKVFEENGFYHCDIELSVYQLYVLLGHHGHIGRLVQVMIKQDYQNQSNNYPNLIDLEANLGSGVIMLADEITLHKIEARRKHEDGMVHYAMRVENIQKVNKLQMIQNTSKVAHMTSIPNHRLIPDIESLKVAYKKYTYYTSINIEEQHAKNKSGLDNPYLFRLARIYNQAS